MGTTLLRLVTAVAFIVVLGSSAGAEAKSKIPIIFQTGQTMFESGPLPAPYDKDSALIGATAGYVCDVTGVFWSYITIEDCQPAAIRGNTFDTSADLAAAVRARYPEPTIPFWAEHGWKLMAGGVVFFVVLCVILGLRSSDDDEANDVATEGRGGDKPQTQFHMAVVEPQLAKDRTAAFEGSTVRPSAPDVQPKFVEGVSSGRRGSQPAIAPLADQAHRDSQPAFAPSQPAYAQAAFAPTPAEPFAPAPYAAFAPNRGSSPITGYEPTTPVGSPRPHTEVPPIAPRPAAMVMAPHLQAPQLAPAQPMRQSPPSMPPAMGMPQPAYAPVAAPAPSGRDRRPSQQPQRDINAYLQRPSQYQRAQREGADAWPQHAISLGSDAALVAHPQLAQGSQPSNLPASHVAHGHIHPAFAPNPTMAPAAFAPAMQPQVALAPSPVASPSYAPLPVAAAGSHAVASQPQAFAPSSAGLQPIVAAGSQPVAAYAPSQRVHHASLPMPMPMPMSPTPMNAQAVQAMMARPINQGAPSTKPAIAVPMPARPSIQPLATARAAVAQPAPVAARPMPVLPAVPPPQMQSGPPEMPPSIGYAQPTVAPVRAKRPSEPAALPVERRFEDARRQPSSPIALAPGVQQYARSPGQATRPATNVLAPHLAARGSQPPVGADLDDVDAQETSLRMDEFNDEAATVLSADAPALVHDDRDATDVMAAIDEQDILAALAPLGGDGPTNHDSSSQKRARTDYNESRRMARGTTGEPVDLHAPVAPELLRATIKIDDPKPHPYVTTRLRRS